MNDSVTQTLFRFVSLRSPELSEEEGQDFRFIFQSPDTQKGVFYDTIANKTASESKKALLKKVANAFSPLNNEELKALSPQLFEFAVWLARNRSTYQVSEVWGKLNKDNFMLIEDHAILWDNLFYQIITQKDFYAKETILQLLVADHLLTNYHKIDTTDVQAPEALERQRRIFLDRLLYAKVVLPAVLFHEEASHTVVTPLGLTYTAVPPQLENQIKADIASFQLKHLQSAKEELDQLKQVYQHAYKQAYEKQQKAHRSLIAPLLHEYEQQLEKSELDETVPKPDYPELPEFEFSFKAEIDAETAQEDFSKSTYHTLAKLQPIATITTFKKAETLLAQKEKALTETVFKGKTFSKKSVSVQGSIVPISTAKNGASDIAYTLIIHAETTGIDYEGDWDWTYYLDLRSDTKNVAIQDVSYGLSYDNGDTGDAGTAYQIIKTVGTSQIQVKLFSDLLRLELDSSDGIPTLSGTIHLINGNTLAFSYKLPPDASIMLFHPYEEANGADGGEGEEGVAEDTPETDTVFTPSGYGMRQLGMADYRKVEQSVHCYVEGEVSHIENVMAREYKEKSSRRLRRSENTISSTSETEKEKLTDTTTTDRFEMQNEVSQLLSESRDRSAYTDLSYGGGNFDFNAGANYAAHTSKEDSINQAVTQAQEITARALDRVVQRVKEERVTKIIEEFEENNKHGFDNRKGSKHVIGVYRWVDKIYKNQIYNYGRRLMYEFVIPQPSKLHRLALTEIAESDTVTLLEQPIDPRMVGLANATMLLESDYELWAAMYNAEVNAPPEMYIYISKAFSDNGNSGNYLTEYNHPGATDFSVEIPENYKAVSYVGKFGYSYVYKKKESNTEGAVIIADHIHTIIDKRFETISISGDLAGDQQSVGIGFHGGDVGGITVSVEIQCERTEQAFEQWRNETFHTIITAYEDKLAEYKAQKEQEESKAVTLREANPLFYRQIEQTILRKNCISYMIDQSPEATAKTYGQQLYSGDTLETYQVNSDQKLAEYVAFAQFIEQAFEWEIMSYKFYPFYWGNRQEWSELYQYENNDPLYRSFMQAGLARVVVTVRPGFEDAVMHYMATGNVWNGGLLPVLEDPLYLAIVDELKQPKGVKEGLAWKTRVPTSLTILQADSIGLKVEKALPCTCEDVADFQEADQTPCVTAIENDESVFESLEVGAGQEDDELPEPGVAEEDAIGELKPN